MQEIILGIGMGIRSKKNWVVVKGVGSWTASLRSVVAKATPSFRRNKLLLIKSIWVETWG